MNSQSLMSLSEYLVGQKYISANQSLTPLELQNQVISILKTQSSSLMNLRTQTLQLKKSLKQLQQRISIQSSNNNNIQSKFMTSSEFKQMFDSWIKDIAFCISHLLVDPLKYYTVFSTMLKLYYDEVQTTITTIMTDIAIKLKVQGQQKQLFLQLLKVFQDNNQKMFVPNSKKYVKIWASLDEQIQENQDIQRVFNDYHKLVIYMLLQEEKWQFVFGNQKQIDFVKKEFVCIDGWIKQKEKALVLIEGLKKAGNMHPNIKNLVIPMPTNYIPKPIQLPKVLNKKSQPQINLQKQEEEKRIKTVQECIKSITDKDVEMSVQLQGRVRKQSTSQVPSTKLVIGKIVKQGSRINTDRKVETEASSKPKIEKRLDKQNICLNTNSLKMPNYKQIIKRKFKDDKSLVRSRQKLMGLYDATIPSKTQRTQKQRDGSSQNRKKKQENRPLKPSQQHIAKFRSKHKLL